MDHNKLWKILKKNTFESVLMRWMKLEPTIQNEVGQKEKHQAITLNLRRGRRKWQPTPGFLPGESHGQRSLMGYSPGGCKESDTTEQLHFFTFISYKINAVKLITVFHQKSRTVTYRVVLLITL